MNKIISGARHRVVTIFLAGLLAILPLVLTVGVIIWVAHFLHGLFGPDTLLGGWLQAMGMHLSPIDDVTLAYVIGCLLVVASVFLLGIVVRTGISNFLDKIVDTLIRRIPIASSVYNAATQIVSLVEKKDDADLKSMSVVYCKFGEANGGGFLTLLPNSKRYAINGSDHYLLYIPTSPIPMTGGLLFMPVEAVQPVDMSVESLMSIYLSMGVTGPELLKDKM